MLALVWAGVLVVAVISVGVQTRDAVARLHHGLELLVFMEPASPARDIASLRHVVTTSTGVRSDHLVVPVVHYAKFRVVLYGSPSLLPCSLPGCVGWPVQDEPSYLQVVMNDRSELVSLETRLVGAEGVDRVVDTESVVADQTNRFRHWRDWGLSGAAALTLSVLLILARPLKRDRVRTS